MNNVIKDGSFKLDKETIPNWSRYASQYDDMVGFLPVYQDNIDSLLEALPSFELPENPRICDLGAGTGNFIIALQEVLPDATFTHVDLDPVMNETARHKYAERDMNVDIVEDYIQRIDFDAGAFDLIICVNALCHAAPQDITLRRMKRWLTKDGTLFVIDFGRPVRLMDWGWYIFSNAVSKIGFINYLKAVVRNRHTFIQNRRAKKGQSEGAMWTHSLKEFEATLSNAGFKLADSRQCYRGYCDFAICKPSISQSDTETLTV